MNDPALWISIGLLGIPAVVFFVSWFRSNNPPPKSKLPTEKDLAVIQQRLQERTINILANRAETIDQPPRPVSPTGPSRSANSGASREYIYFAPPIVSPFEKELLDKERDLLQKERDLQDLRADIKVELERLTIGYDQLEQKRSQLQNLYQKKRKRIRWLLTLSFLFIAVLLPSVASVSKSKGYAEGCTVGSIESFTNGVFEGYDTGIFLRGSSSHEYRFHLNRAYLPNSSNRQIVYITRTGSCYHLENCGHLYSSYAIPLSEAEKLGFSPCSHCSPLKLEVSSWDD